MMSMEERREAIRAQLQGGKRMTLRELATAIGVETERTRTAVRKECVNWERCFKSVTASRGQRGVYRLTRSGETPGGASEAVERKMIDGIWPNEVEKAKNRVQVGDRLKVAVYADTRTEGVARILRRTVRVVSKHRHLVRTSDGSSSTYAELAMYYRGKILDRR